MPFLAQHTNALTCLAWSQNVKQDYSRQPLRLPCFEIWFPENGLQCSEGGRIYKHLHWKAAENHLTQLSTAHRSKERPINSAAWGFYWLLHDFVRLEVGWSSCLEEVEGLLCFFVLCGRAWSISSDTAFCLPLYSEYTSWDHEVRAEKRKPAEERSFWTHIKIFEKSDGEGKSARTHSAAFLSGDFQK